MAKQGHMSVANIDTMMRSPNPVRFKDMLILNGHIGQPATDELLETINKFTGFPVRLDMQLYLHCNKGSGRMTIDSKVYTFSENDMVIIGMGSIIESLEFFPGFEGASVAIAENGITLEGNHKIHKYFRRHVVETHVVHMPPDQFRRSLGFYYYVKDVIERDNYLCQEEAIEAAMVTYSCFFVNKVVDPFPEYDAPELRWKGNKLAGAFISSVSINYSKDRDIASYAKRLMVTPKHLSNVVLKQTGRKPKDIIQEYVIRNAKQKLESGLYTVQEVSDSLNFPNQSFFAKYYKRATGHAPGEDRCKD